MADEIQDATRPITNNFNGPVNLTQGSRTAGHGSGQRGNNGADDYDHRPQRRNDEPRDPYGSNWNGWKAIAVIAVVAILAAAAYGMSGNVANSTKFGKVDQMTASLYKDEQAGMTARNASDNTARIEVAKANATATAAMNTGPLVINTPAPARVTDVRGGPKATVNLLPGRATMNTDGTCTLHYTDGSSAVGRVLNGGCIKKT